MKRHSMIKIMKNIVSMEIHFSNYAYPIIFGILDIQKSFHVIHKLKNGYPKNLGNNRNKKNDLYGYL